MTWLAARWRWRWLRPPWSSASSSSSLAVANELGRRIDLDRNGLDSPIGPVATLAASIVNGGSFVVIEEGGRTFTAHACIAHNTDIPSKHDHWTESVSAREVRGRQWKDCNLTAPVYAGAHLEATLEGLQCVQIIVFFARSHYISEAVIGVPT